ncbi:sugar ABC transporter permease, partial [Amaricoccus sp. HAR-UPW-R2A-40]
MTLPLSAETDAAALLAVQERRRKASLAVRYAILTLVGFVMLYPLIWLIGASFKTNAEIFQSPGFLPADPTIQGYIDGWRTSTPYTFARFFWNTFLIIAPKTLFTV